MRFDYDMDEDLAGISKESKVAQMFYSPISQCAMLHTIRRVPKGCPGGRLLVRGKDEGDYKVIGDFQSNVSCDHPIYCGKTNTILFVTSRWFGDERGSGGDWEDLCILDIATLKVSKLLSKGEIIPPEGLQMINIIDLISVEKPGETLLFVAGHEKRTENSMNQYFGVAVLYLKTFRVDLQMTVHVPDF